HKGGLLGGSARSAEEVAKRRKEERERKVEQAVRRLVLDQIVQADRPTLSPDEMRLIAVGIMGRLLHESRKLFAQRRNIEPLKTKWGGKNYDGPARRLLDQVPITALPTLLLELTLLDELHVATHNMPGSTKPKRLLATAQLCGVDPDTIRAKIVAAARAKKKRPGSTIRKKAGKKSPKTRRAPRRQASGARTTDAGDSAA
ncbi:MAG: hypothetical protein QME77_09900, partial [bacterium]|nr:hypothetical protein [bacterium]